MIRAENVTGPGTSRSAYLTARDDPRTSGIARIRRSVNSAARGHELTVGQGPDTPKVQGGNEMEEQSWKDRSARTGFADVHPNSLWGRARKAGDTEALKRISTGRREAIADELAMLQAGQEWNGDKFLRRGPFGDDDVYDEVSGPANPHPGRTLLPEVPSNGRSGPVRVRMLSDLTEVEIIDLRRRFPSFDPEDVYAYQRRMAEGEVETR